MTRKPHLIDLIDIRYHKRFGYHSDAIKTLIDARHTAKRFILDDHAAFMLGATATSMADLILEQAEFARPPFDVCYFELSARACYDGRVNYAPHVNPDSADDTIAFLWSHGTLYIIAQGPDTEGKDILLGPLSITPNEPQHAAASPLTDLQKRIWLLGYMRVRDQYQTVQRVDLIVPPPGLLDTINVKRLDGVRTIKPDGWEEFSWQSGGDYLVAVTLLLLLNQPSKSIVINDQAPSRGFVGGKNVVFPRQSNIMINLHPRETLLHLLTTEGHGSRRWGTVRGHWTHRGGTLECSHSYEPRDLTGKRFECAHCQRKRTWREYPHGRGDKTKGIVDQQWSVRP